MKNQRKTVLADGTLDVNADWDCVAESIAAGLQFLNNKQYEGGILKETVYGRNYQGGTAATSYVDYCAAEGVTLSSLDGAGPDLVRAAHAEVSKGHPVVFTEPDPYCTAYQRDTLGWSHVCVFFAEAQGTLTAMDPFGGFPVQHTDAEWASLLLFNQIWILHPTHQEDQPMATLQSPNIARYFEDAGNGRIKRRDKNIVMGQGFTTFFLKYGGVFRLPITGEIGVKDHPGVVFMVTEACIMIYDPDRKLDTAPTEGPCYLMHTDSGPGQRLVAQAILTPLEQEVARLSKQLATQPNNTGLATENAQLKAHLQKIKEIVNS